MGDKIISTKFGFVVDLTFHVSCHYKIVPSFVVVVYYSVDVLGSTELLSSKEERRVVVVAQKQ